MTRCASGLIKFQDSLIINISRKNQLIPLSDHGHSFLFISLHLLSNLASKQLSMTCFWGGLSLLFCYHGAFVISLTHSSADFQNISTERKAGFKNLTYYFLIPEKKFSTSKIYFWSCWIFWKDKFCMLKSTVNYCISQWWLHGIKEILLLTWVSISELVNFYSPWSHLKTHGSLTFSEWIEVN